MKSTSFAVAGRLAVGSQGVTGEAATSNVEKKAVEVRNAVEGRLADIERMTVMGLDAVIGRLINSRIDFEV